MKLLLIEDEKELGVSKQNNNGKLIKQLKGYKKTTCAQRSSQYLL